MIRVANEKRLSPRRKRILNAAQIKVILERFAREMSKQYGNLESVVFIGIRTRGPYVAKRLAEIHQEAPRQRNPRRRDGYHACIATI